MSCNVELYGEIGTGRDSDTFQKTVTYKGRVKESIEFIAAKTMDIQKLDYITHGLEIQHNLDHENIVKFVNWFQTESKLYVIVEYCPGGTLSELLNRDLCLPESVIRIFAADLLNALFYLHVNSVLFCDFDPNNILLDENGVLKLNDFSNSRTIDETFDPSHVHPTSIGYLAPELFSSNGVPSFASDHYSFGCMIYRMASGSIPFLSQDQFEQISRIQNEQVFALPGYSKEFNDLMIRLMIKNPYQRPSWIDIVKHPFWKGSLADSALNDIESIEMPSQELFEASRSSISRITTVSEALKLSIKREQVFEAKFEDSDAIAEDPLVRIRELIVDCSLVKPVSLFFNPTIEGSQIPSVDATSLPINNHMLRVADPEEFERAIVKIRNYFEGADRVKTKTPLLNYLLQNSKTTEVANNFINSSFSIELICLSEQTKHPVLAAGYLFLFGSIIRHASSLPVSLFQNEKLLLLQNLSSSPHDIVARKAIAVSGELLSFIARSDTSYSFIPQLTRLVFTNLQSTDEITRHYSIRCIANILYSQRAQEVFRFNEIEPIIVSFQTIGSPFLLETWSACVTSLYSNMKPTSMDFVSTTSRILIGKSNPSLQQLGIVLSAETDSLPSTKDEIVKCFKSAIGDVRIKLMLAMCLIFNHNPTDFIDSSSRFYSSLEKIHSENQQIYEIIVNWTAVFCEFIIDSVIAGGSCDILQIVIDAMNSKLIASKVWTPKFGKKIQRLVKENNFSNPGTEFIIQVIEQGLKDQVADFSIICDLSRAINSPKEIVRFTSIKLIADSCETIVVPEVSKFIEDTLIPQSVSLVHDKSYIPDHAIRIYSKISGLKPHLIPQFTKPNILPIIFQKATENSSALDLSTMIVSEGTVQLDSIVSARIVPSLLSVLDKGDKNPLAFSFLLQTLILIDKNTNEVKYPGSHRKVIKSFGSIATKAPICASLALENPIAADCLSLMIRIFTPQSTQNEILIESAFGPFSITLTTGYKKPECASVLSRVLTSLQSSAMNCQAMRLRLKGNQPFMAALKKAAENGSEVIKEVAVQTLKVIKG